MTPWLLLTALVAATNLAALLVVRGRWGRIVWALLPAAAAGTAAGDAAGGAMGLKLMMAGDFHVMAASVGAQLAMLMVLLLANAIPTDAEREAGR